MNLLRSQFNEIDNSQLVVFRMAFGFLIFAESIGAILTGWVRKALIEPDYNFTLIGLEWLQPLDGYGMYVYFGLMGLCGIGVLLGYHYRLSITLFTILWTCVYWMQKSNYNNHYYLLILLCLFMIMVPANGYLSIDSKRKAALKTLSCPKWSINIFILLLWIVYTYASLHKLYPGWLEGDFISLSFSLKADYPIIGNWLQNPILQKFIVYGGIVFDLTIIPLLLINRSRKAAFIIAIFFHLFNSAVFQIGIFPYLMIASSVFFFEPETIRKIFFKKKPPFQELYTSTGLSRTQKVWTGAMVAFFVIQLLLPLRHLRYQGDVFYTEEGHRLSWRMMLRSKTGTLTFRLKDTASDSTWTVKPIKFVTPKQSRAMATKPDMIWQMAQYLENHYQGEGLSDIQVRADAFVRLNRGKRVRLINQNTDLTQVPWDHLKHSSWILSPK